MSTTVTIDKKVLLDLISHVAMVASEASTGVILKDDPQILERYRFLHANELPQDLAEHVERVLSDYIAVLLSQPTVLKEAKSLTNYVSQATLFEWRGDTCTARERIHCASLEIPKVVQAIKDFAELLNSAE